MKKTLFILLAFAISSKVLGQSALKLNMHLQYQPFEHTSIRDSIYTEIKEGFDLSILPNRRKHPLVPIKVLLALLENILLMPNK